MRASPLRLAARALRWLVALAIVFAFVAYVWPTRFRYDHMTVDGNLVPVRIDRVSGDSDMLVPDEGWVPVEGTDEGPGGTPSGAVPRPGHPPRAPRARPATARAAGS